MIKSTFIIFMLITTEFVSAQFTPQLWNDNLKLKKENVSWISKTTYQKEIADGITKEYKFSEISIAPNENRKITTYNVSGEIISIGTINFENPNLEVYKSQDGDKEVREFDADNNLISEKWTYSDGSSDEKIFTYENGQLVQIIQKDEFDIYREELKYEEKLLSQILSIDESGEVVMERKLSYNDFGSISQIQRIEDGEVNKLVSYIYDDSNKLLQKIEDKVNRFTGAAMPQEVYDYVYHKNGVLKQETWTIYKNVGKTEIRDIFITEYNDIGLEIKEVCKDFSEYSEETLTYKYRMK